MFHNCNIFKHLHSDNNKTFYTGQYHVGKGKKKQIHTRKPDKEESSFAFRQYNVLSGQCWNSVYTVWLSILLPQHCPLYLRIAATYKNANIAKYLEYLIKWNAHVRIIMTLQGKLAHKWQTWNIQYFTSSKICFWNSLLRLKGTDLQHDLSSSAPKLLSKANLGLQNEKLRFGEHYSWCATDQKLPWKNYNYISSEVTILSEITNHNALFLNQQFKPMA